MHLWEIHPALVHFPIAFFILGTCLDIYGTYRGRPELSRMGQGTLVLGLGTGLVAAFFGLVAFVTLPRLDPDYASYLSWHLGLNVVAMAAFAIPVISRWGDRWPRVFPYALIAEVVGCLLLVASGYLGHAAVIRGGAGVRPEILVTPKTTPTLSSPAAQPRTP